MHKIDDYLCPTMIKGKKIYRNFLLYFICFNTPYQNMQKIL